MSPKNTGLGISARNQIHIDCKSLLCKTLQPMLKERQVFCPDKLRTSSIMQCNY